MTVSVESAQTKQLSESNRKRVVEKKNAVFRAEEWSCYPNIQFAEYPIEDLRKAAPKLRQQIEIYIFTASE